MRLERAARSERHVHVDVSSATRRRLPPPPTLAVQRARLQQLPPARAPMLSKTALRLTPRGAKTLLTAASRPHHKPRAPSGRFRATAMASPSIFKDVAQAPPDPILVRHRAAARDPSPEGRLPARRGAALTRRCACARDGARRRA